MIKIGHIELPDNPLLLAPMEDVSDPPFRHLCKKHGADMLYTEFISSDGLIRDAEKSVKKLDIFDDERPVGIQIFGGEEGPMMRSAEIVEAAKPEKGVKTIRGKKGNMERMGDFLDQLGSRLPKNYKFNREEANG